MNILLDNPILLFQSEELAPGIVLALLLILRWHFNEVFLNNFTSLGTNKKCFKQIFWTMKRPLYNLYTLPSPENPLFSQPGLWIEAAFHFVPQMYVSLSGWKLPDCFTWVNWWDFQPSVTPVFSLIRFPFQSVCVTKTSSGFCDIFE